MQILIIIAIIAISVYVAYLAYNMWMNSRQGQAGPGEPLDDEFEYEDSYTPVNPYTDSGKIQRGSAARGGTRQSGISKLQSDRIQGIVDLSGAEQGTTHGVLSIGSMFAKGSGFGQLSSIGQSNASKGQF